MTPQEIVLNSIASADRDRNTEREIVTALSQLDPSSSIEDIAATMGMLDAMMQRAKELRAEFEQQCIEWIKANGEIEIGTVRYFIGNPKTHKDNDPGETLEVLLEVSGGDLDGIKCCLSSGAFKHGAVKKFLEEHGDGRYEQLFTVIERERLEEGKVKPQLQKVDSRFIK